MFRFEGKNNTYAQQGDVLLAAVSDIPATAKLKQTDVLQEGEHTGHAHRLHGGEYTVFEVPETKEMFLKVLKPVSLKHEEHKPISMPPGNYKIGIVQEYDPFQKLVRKVID